MVKVFEFYRKIKLYNDETSGISTADRNSF